MDQPAYKEALEQQDPTRTLVTPYPCWPAHHLFVRVGKQGCLRKVVFPEDFVLEISQVNALIRQLLASFEKVLEFRVPANRVMVREFSRQDAPQSIVECQGGSGILPSGIKLARGIAYKIPGSWCLADFDDSCPGRLV